MIVGIDISTSCTGVCILNDDGTFQHADYIELKKIDNFYSKVDEVINYLIDELHIPGEGARFYIEAPLLHFKMKASMASTIALLQRFNACVCYAIYGAYRQQPKLISVVSARKALGISIPKRTPKKNSKQMVFEQVKSRNAIPTAYWAYKKTGRPKDWCYDMADAYVIARAAYEEEARSSKKEKEG